MVGISILPVPGDTIAGKYRLETPLGRGGMSVVYGATHCVTGRRFAIKLLLPEVSVNPDAARRFIRESQVSGRVQHPNVVEVFDIGEDRGSHYMVMEWLDGESLADRIERCGPLAMHEINTLLLPCMRGVAAAHAAGIVHRDLKPANIFVCRATPERAEHAKVLDFGISKVSFDFDVTAAVTHTGVVIGTPHYMSPEQMQGQPVDIRTDIYAFGVILYQVFSARLPFPAQTYGELVLQIATGRPEPLEQLVPELPPAMAPLVAKAMARDPADRFQSMGELISAVESAARASTHIGSAAGGRVSTRGPSTPWSTESKDTLNPLPHPAGRRARAGRLRVYASVAAVALTFALLTLWRLRAADGHPEAAPSLAGQPSTVMQSLQAQPSRTAATATVEAPQGLEKAGVTPPRNLEHVTLPAAAAATSAHEGGVPPSSASGSDLAQPETVPTPRPDSARHPPRRTPAARRDADRTTAKRKASAQPSPPQPVRHAPSQPEAAPERNPLQMQIQ